MRAKYNGLLWMPKVEISRNDSGSWYQDDPSGVFL